MGRLANKHGQQTTLRKLESFVKLYCRRIGWLRYPISGAMGVLVWHHYSAGTTGQEAMQKQWQVLGSAQKGPVEESAGSHLLLINIMYCS